MSDTKAAVIEMTRSVVDARAIGHHPIVAVGTIECVTQAPTIGMIGEPIDNPSVTKSK